MGKLVGEVIKNEQKWLFKEYKVYNILSDIGACLCKIVKVSFDDRAGRKF